MLKLFLANLFERDRWKLIRYAEWLQSPDPEGAIHDALCTALKRGYGTSYSPRRLVFWAVKDQFRQQQRHEKGKRKLAAHLRSLSPTSGCYRRVALLNHGEEEGRTTEASSQFHATMGTLPVVQNEQPLTRQRLLAPYEMSDAYILAMDVRAALQQLPRDERTMVIGCLMHGETLHAMAAMLGKKKSWAFDVLHSGKDKLRKILEEYS